MLNLHSRAKIDEKRQSEINDDHQLHAQQQQRIRCSLWRDVMNNAQS